ncbi:hypothetical protein T484DRAFT_1898176 [Baffinella frigidus]|nr:hypothetical protein T484DRAFT_1898176 [Cryptophyta sp. CCMP2293]
MEERRMGAECDLAGVLARKSISGFTGVLALLQSALRGAVLEEISVNLLARTTAPSKRVASDPKKLSNEPHPEKALSRLCVLLVMTGAALFRSRRLTVRRQAAPDAEHVSSAESSLGAYIRKNARVPVRAVKAAARHACALLPRVSRDAGV